RSVFSPARTVERSRKAVSIEYSADADRSRARSRELAVDAVPVLPEGDSDRCNPVAQERLGLGIEGMEGDRGAPVSGETLRRRSHLFELSSRTQGLCRRRPVATAEGPHRGESQ